MIGLRFADASPNVRIAVLNVSNTSEWKQNSEIVTNNFTGVLARSNSVTVVEREKLELVIREQKIKFSQIQSLNSEAVKEIGKIVGCQYLLLSSLVYEVSPIISVSIVDTQTSEIFFSETENPDSLDNSSLIAASVRLADKVLEVLAGEQTVITDIKGGEIIINRGSSSGVRKGMFYRVYEDASANIAIIKVKDVLLHSSRAETVKNGGNIKDIRRGNKVEAISKKDAGAIIKQRKFTKTTKREIADLVTNGWQKMDEETVFFQKFNRSFDILVKRGETSIAQKDAKILYTVASNIKHLGQVMIHRKNSNKLDKKLKNVPNDMPTKFQKKMDQRTEKFDEAIDKCYSKAVHFAKLSAELGNTEAKAMLGRLYAFPGEWGMPPNYQEGAKFLKQASGEGNAEAQCALGSMYRMGLGVKQDYKQAAELYKKAVKNGYVPAFNDLGSLYNRGMGVEQDYKKAVELSKKQLKLVMLQQSIIYRICIWKV